MCLLITLKLIFSSISSPIPVIIIVIRNNNNNNNKTLIIIVIKASIIKKVMKISVIK